MNLNFYLDEAKKLLDIKHDAVLAEKLGITRQKLYNAREKGWMAMPALIKLGEINGVDKLVMLAAREESRDQENHDEWQKVGEILKGIGAAAGIAGIVLFASYLTGDLESVAQLSLVPTWFAGIKITGIIVVVAAFVCIHLSRRFCFKPSTLSFA